MKSFFSHFLSATLCVVALCASTPATLYAQLQVESSCMNEKTGSFYDFDKNNKHNRIIQMEDGFYYFMYDDACRDLEIYDEAFFLKIFMGKTYNDVLTSMSMLEDWFKNNKVHQYMTVSNPNGQKILIYRGYASCIFTNGTLDDIKMYLLDAESKAHIGGEEAKTTKFTRVRSQIDEGTYHPTKGIFKQDMRAAFQKFKKQYKNLK